MKDNDFSINEDELNSLLESGSSLFGSEAPIEVPEELPIDNKPEEPQKQEDKVSIEKPKPKPETNKNNNDNKNSNNINNKKLNNPNSKNNSKNIEKEKPKENKNEKINKPIKKENHNAQNNKPASKPKPKLSKEEDLINQLNNMEYDFGTNDLKSDNDSLGIQGNIQSNIQNNIQNNVQKDKENKTKEPKQSMDIKTPLPTPNISFEDDDSIEDEVFDDFEENVNIVTPSVEVVNEKEESINDDEEELIDDMEDAFEFDDGDEDDEVTKPKSKGNSKQKKSKGKDKSRPKQNLESFDMVPKEEDEGLSLIAKVLIITVILVIVGISGYILLNKNEQPIIGENENYATVKDSYLELSSEIESTLMNLSLYLNNRITYDVLVTNLESEAIPLNSKDKTTDDFFTKYSAIHTSLVNDIKDAKTTDNIDKAIDNYVASINNLEIEVNNSLEKFLQKNGIEYSKTDKGIQII